MKHGRTQTTTKKNYVKKKELSIPERRKKNIRSIFFLFLHEKFSPATRIKRKYIATRDTNRGKVHKCVEQDIINEFFLFDLTTVFHNTHIYSYC